MTTHRLRVSSSFVLLALALAGPACVGFISSDSGTTSDTGDTTGDGDGDPTTGDGDGDGDPTTGDGDGDPAGDTTIYEIQQGMIPEGTTVSVQGVIMTSPVDTEYGLAFVEEPGAGEYSGISLYLWDEVVMGVQLQPGDVVDLVGEYGEWNGASQLIIKDPADVAVVGSDALPGPDVVDVAAVARTNVDAEPWEGVRVRVNDVTVAQANDGFGQYLLVGDALVGHTYLDPLPEVVPGGTFASVTGELHYSFDEFKIMVNDGADLDGYMDPPPPMNDTPIYEIQQGMVPEGTPVLLENVIASSGLTWTDAADASFFVQEPGGGAFSGIEVHVGDIAGVQITPGDDLTIVGLYDEFYDMSQIEVAGAASITVNGSGPAPAPEIIADPASIATNGAAAEDWEGVLVRVENVTVTNENPDDPMEFGEFAVTGDLRVDDVFFAMADWTKPALDTVYASITGPLVYSFDNFKLEPRDNADLVAN
jgi:hypothetical protein